jgi:hypothetical protein
MALLARCRTQTICGIVHNLKTAKQIGLAERAGESGQRNQVKL